jgi:protein-S-isoprenylcysteine O-methyltransferase Ste14
MLGFGLRPVLATAKWVLVGLALLMVLGLVARAPREEEMTVEQFGEESRACMRRTGRFFPRQPGIRREAQGMGRVSGAGVWRGSGTDVC